MRPKSVFLSLVFSYPAKTFFSSTLLADAFLVSLFLLASPGAAGAAGGLLCSLPVRGVNIPQVPVSPQSGNPLSAGKFLVARRGLPDPIFSKAVILLVGYGNDGAMGLIVNRPSKMPLSKLFPAMKGLEKRGDLAYIGGPVEMDRLFLLASAKGRPGKSLKIFDGVYISFDKEALKAMAGDPRARFRIYAGYAGWSAGQLESEMARGDWYIVAADAGTIFDRSAESIWPDLIQRAGMEVQRQKARALSFAHLDLPLHP